MMVTTGEHLLPGPVEQGVGARILEVVGVQNRGPQQHERRVVRDRWRDRGEPSLRDDARQRRQRRVDEVDGKIAEQPPVPCLAGQPAGAGQVAAGGEDRDGAFPQGVLVLPRDDPRQRIRPQVVRAVTAVVQHPHQRHLPGQVIEGDGTARDLGDLAGGAIAERGQRGQRLTLRVAYPAENLLAGILPRRGGPGRER